MICCLIPNLISALLTKPTTVIGSNLLNITSQNISITILYRGILDKIYTKLIINLKIEKKEKFIL